MDEEVGGRSLRPIRHMESVVGRRTDASEDYPLADTSLADGCLDLLKEIGAGSRRRTWSRPIRGTKATIVFSPGSAVFSSGGVRPPTLTSDEQEGSRHNTQ